MCCNPNTSARNVRSNVHVPAPCGGAPCSHHQTPHMWSGGKDSDDIDLALSRAANQPNTKENPDEIQHSVPQAQTKFAAAGRNCRRARLERSLCDGRRGPAGCVTRQIGWTEA